MNERAIFEAALEIQDPAARRAYLDKACTDSQDLRRQVEMLLESHQAAGSFLDIPAIDQLHSGSANVRDRTLDFSPQTGTESDNDSDDDPISLDFLKPSAKPGSLGRLAHYETLQVLGKGGFGIVLKAFDEKLHRLVAIKVMNPAMAATSPPRKRFLREARAAAAIRHENVVAVHSVEEQPLPYLVMDYIDGQTLHQKMDSAGPLEVSEVLHVGRQIASGLAAAHAMGLIHRDIKPGNILLEQGPDQKVRLTDFGLARAADDASMTRTGHLCGTPMYMAPEQVQGQALDHRADLFSFGSVLYQMACGRPPFRAPTTVAVLRRVSDDTPRPMREILPEIPDWLVAIVAKLHAKNPDERFQSAVEVADLLARCQSELRLNGEVTSVDEVASTSAAFGQTTRTASESDAHISTSRPIGRRVTPRAGSFSRRRIAALAAISLLLAGLAGGILFGGQIFRLVTNQGELIIEVDGKDIDVKIVQNGVVVQDKTSKREFSLTAGKGEIEVLEKDGIKLATRQFELTRGGQTTVKVTLQDLADTRLPQPNAKPVLSVAPELSANGAPSPFDALRREDIPPDELAMAGGGDPAKAPPELVAVVGDSRLRHWYYVRSIVFTPDGKSLISSSWDQTVRIWDVATGRQTQVLQTNEDESIAAIFLALSQDGKTLVSMNEHLIKVWDLPSRKERQELRAGRHWGLSPSLSQDGSLLLVSADGAVNLIELGTGMIMQKWAHALFTGGIDAQTLSPDGTLVAVGHSTGALKLFSVADGKELLDLKGHKGRIPSLVFSPDGRTLVSGGDEGLNVWDVQTGKKQRSVADQAFECRVVAFSADGKYLAAGDHVGKVRIWKTETFVELPSLTLPNAQYERNSVITAMAFSPDGKALAAGMASGIIKLWDLATGKEQLTFPGQQASVTSLAVASSGKLMATACFDGTVRLVDVPSLQERFRLEAEDVPVHAVAFSPDSQTLFAGTGGQHERLARFVLAWGLKDGKLGRMFGRIDQTGMSVAVSPEGMTLAAAASTSSTEIKLWDVPARMEHEELTTREARLTLKGVKVVSSLVFSPDGTMLATSGYDDTRLWDVASGKQQRAYKNASGRESSVAFSPDGELLAAATNADTTVYEVATGEEYTHLPPIIGSLAVAFGSDNKLYTAGMRGTVQIWDLNKQGTKRLEKEIRIGPPGGWIEQLVLTPDGRHLLTRNYNGTTYVLRLSAPPSAR